MHFITLSPRNRLNPCVIVKLRKYIALVPGGKDSTVKNEQKKIDFLEQQVASTSTDAMRNFVISVAKSLTDEELLRMLYIRAKNLNKL